METPNSEDPTVQFVSSLEAVRRRPEMYIGASQAAMTDLAFEAMCLALAEAACGSVRSISVHVEGHHLRVADDGVGISLEPDEQGMPFAQRAMTVLGACRDHKEHVRLKQELCNAGLPVVNALSVTASVTRSDGKSQHRQTYTDGVADGPFVETGIADPSGTVLEFKLDPKFVAEPFDESKLRARVAALAVDFTGLTLAVEH